MSKKKSKKPRFRLHQSLGFGNSLAKAAIGNPSVQSLEQQKKAALKEPD